MTRVRVRRVFVLVVALVVIVVTAQLGRWQLSRAAQKKAMERAMSVHAELPVLDGAVLRDALTPQRRAELLYRHISVRGHWLPAQTVFLDNRTMDHEAGFYVLTPLRLAGSDRAVVVVRGWAARDFYDPRRLPEFETPDGEVEVEGRLLQEAPRIFALSEQADGPIRQNLHLDAFAAETGLPLAGMLVQQLGPPSEGLQRDWPQVTVDVERNYGYAVQWFGMSLLTVFLLLWFQWIRPYLRARERR